MPVDRRRFLTETGRATAGAALGLTALAGRSFPAEAKRRASPNDTIVCALIGAGGRGNYLMNLAAREEDVAVTAVCDANRQNLARTAASLGKIQERKVKQASDFRHLLDDKSLDAVFVATPHHWHAPIAVRALDAGKHVYVEKPASHVFREGRLLVEAARRNKRVVQQGTQMRSSEVTAAAAKVLSGGVLGEIKMSKAWGVEPRGNHPQAVPDRPAPDWPPE